MKLSFLGAAGEVTGSCYLVETATSRFLVDCGMFQGGREADEKNYADFAFDPRALDFVLLTHAHIDHSGLLPRLCAQGFRGAIHTTAATIDLLEVMLLDSAHIQEKELEWRQRAHGRPNGGVKSRAGVQPLYSVAQAQASLAQLRAVALRQRIPARSPACAAACATPATSSARRSSRSGSRKTAARPRSCSPATSAMPASRSCAT